MAPHQLRVRAGDQFAYDLHLVDIGESSLGYHSYRGAAEVVASAPIDGFGLQVLLKGAMEVSSNFGTVQLTAPRSACVVSPTDRLRLRYAPGTEQLFVTIPTRAMEQGFGRLTGEAGGGRTVFAVLAPADAAWLHTLQLIVSAIDAIDTAEALPPRLGDELERMLLGSLLIAQPHSSRRLITNGLPVPTGRTVREVTTIAEELRAAPEQHFDFAELAKAHGISLRTLQEGFRRRYGRTPTSFLRDQRLEMAHRLLTTDPHSSVTDVAFSSGFTHLGRFARDYKQRYGVSPSATLEQARAGSSD